jgi:hypothetical protein
LKARPHVPRAGVPAAPPPESAPLAGAFPGSGADGTVNLGQETEQG